MLPFLRMLLPKREEKSPTTQVEQVEPMSCPEEDWRVLHTSWLDDIPEEVALHILSFLSARDLGQLAQTSRYYSRLTEEKELWKELYYSLSKRQPSAQSIQNVGWKWLYLGRLKTDYGKPPHVTVYNPSHFTRKHYEDHNSDDEADPLKEDFSEMNRGLGGIGCLGVYAEKDILIGGTMRGKMLAVDISTGKLLRCIPAHKHTLSCLSINQNLAVTGSWDTTLQVWDLDTYSSLTTLTRPGEIGYIRCCQVDKSRGLVVSGSNDNSIKIWELETGCHLDTIRGHDGAVTGLSFHEDRLITGSWDRTVRLWSLKDKECAMVLKDQPGDKYCAIRYDPVHELVYGGREDQHIAVFDLRAGRFMCRLTGHTSWVYGLALDDTTLFSGSMDGKVRIWDREKNECYNELGSVGTSCVHALLVYDNILYSANEDSSIRAMDFSGPLGRSRAGLTGSSSAREGFPT